MVLRKKLRIIASGKRLVIFSSTFALLCTLLIVKNLKGKEVVKDDDENDYFEFFENALQGKKAVSVSISVSDIPAELMYPGVRVDVLQKGKSKPSGVVEDVLVLSMNIIDDNTIKVTLALTDEQGKILNTFQQNQLSIMVRGKGIEKTKDNKDEDIEIVEL